MNLKGIEYTHTVDDGRRSGIDAMLLAMILQL